MDECLNSECNEAEMHSAILLQRQIIVLNVQYYFSVCYIICRNHLLQHQLKMQAGSGLLSHIFSVVQLIWLRYPMTRIVQKTLCIKLTVETRPATLVNVYTKRKSFKVRKYKCACLTLRSDHTHRKWTGSDWLGQWLLLPWCTDSIRKKQRQNSIKKMKSWCL